MMLRVRRATPGQVVFRSLETGVQREWMEGTVGDLLRALVRRGMTDHRDGRMRHGWVMQPSGHSGTPWSMHRWRSRSWQFKPMARR